VRREIEDLAALIAEAGAPAFVCGFSSGAVLALDAAAAGLFLTAAVGMPAEFVVGMRQSPFWSALEAIAHTIAYDTCAG
jgi:alpha-beta hydrolase superfamily lysophospholipase